MHIYVHIPFCRRRCIYCDFYFVTTRADHGPFLSALRQEIRYRGRHAARPAPVRTIYFGGGTPSLLSVDAVAGILEDVRAAFDASSVEEITLELNPDDVDVARLAGLRAAGVNRLSIGIQSFFQDDLDWMNRSHTAEQAARIVPAAREAGFENISVDLIFGRPGQPATAWEDNLARVVALGIPHISTYSLTIEPRTPLHKRVAQELEQPAPDDEMAHRYRTAMRFLKAHGYEHYEVSSFARPGHRSRHNQAYWRHADYLGFGPSAHSFLRMDAGRAERWANVRNLKHYEAWPSAGTPPVELTETLGRRELAQEYVLLGMRTAEGIDLERLKADYDASLDVGALSPLVEAGWLERAGTAIRLTAEWMLVCDAVTTAVLDGVG